MPFNTTLKSETFLDLHFDAKSIDLHLPGCNESQLFIELGSMANLFSINARIIV